jgi:hypothetical protein
MIKSRNYYAMTVVPKTKRFFRVKARMKGCGGYTNAMRPTIFGNPFSLDKYDLEDSLQNYYTDLWLRNMDGDLDLHLAIQDLLEQEYVYLGCTCQLNKPCHVDILIKFIKERYLPE